MLLLFVYPELQNVKHIPYSLTVDKQSADL